MFAIDIYILFTIKTQAQFIYKYKSFFFLLTMPPKNQKKKDISDPTMPDKEVKTPAKRGRKKKVSVLNNDGNEAQELLASPAPAPAKRDRKKKEPILNNDGNEAQELLASSPAPAPTPAKPNKRQKLQEPITAPVNQKSDVTNDKDGEDYYSENDENESESNVNESENQDDDDEGNNSENYDDENPAINDLLEISDDELFEGNFSF